MTAIVERPETAELLEASEHETRMSIRRALERAGLSEEQLRQQALENNFSTVSARMAWMALCDLEAFGR